MAATTSIEWTDATWNPVTGCSVCSPGCANCYAMLLAGTRLQHHASRAGLTQSSKAGPVWTGEVRLNEAWLDQPLRWKRPRDIFVCAHGDLFHPGVEAAWIDRVFGVMLAAPWHRYQVLTKRVDRMQSEILRIFGGAAPPAHIWLGISVVNQTEADRDVPKLLATPAGMRFLSMEPLLGPVELYPEADRTYQFLSRWYGPEGFDETGSQPLQTRMRGYFPRLDWIIVGGESGPGARPIHPDWVISLRDQCEAAAVPFLFKQWGEHLPVHVDTILQTGIEFRRVGKRAAGRRLHGVEHNGMPA